MGLTILIYQRFTDLTRVILFEFHVRIDLG